MKEEQLKKFSESLNTLRMESLNKTFTRDEILEKLYEIGFNRCIAPRILSLFSFEKLGTARLYSFKKEHIHMGQILAFYKKAEEYKKHKKTSPQMSEKDVLRLVETYFPGYGLVKLKFDLKKFAKENLEMYKKYLIYETL